MNRSRAAAMGLLVCLWLVATAQTVYPGFSPLLSTLDDSDQKSLIALTPPFCPQCF